MGREHQQLLKKPHPSSSAACLYIAFSPGMLGAPFLFSKPADTRTRVLGAGINLSAQPLKEAPSFCTTLYVKKTNINPARALLQSACNIAALGKCFCIVASLSGVLSETCPQQPVLPILVSALPAAGKPGTAPSATQERGGHAGQAVQLAIRPWHAALHAQYHELKNFVPLL